MIADFPLFSGERDGEVEGGVADLNAKLMWTGSVMRGAPSVACLARVGLADTSLREGSSGNCPSSGAG